MASVMICTPCYGNMIGTGYFHSIIGTMNLLAKKGHQVHIKTIGNESLITRARNNLLAYFLSSSFEKMMFIDADISWPPEAVLTLLESGKPVCGIPYPTKNFDWERAAQFVNQSNSPVKPDELRQSSLILTINRATGSVEQNGWLEVDALATGFLMMDRSALEQMRDHYRDTLSYCNDVAYYSTITQPENCVGLFECMIDPDGRRYLSEDYAFCRRWRDLGGTIHCCTQHRLTHTGSANF